MRTRSGFNQFRQPPRKKSNKIEFHLIRRAKAGDQEAFSQLYTQHINAIYRFIFSRVSEGMIADDLTSQVFLKAWENFGQYQEQDLPLRAWLFRIARNTLIDHYRATKNYECMDLLSSDAPDPEADIEELLNVHLDEEEMMGAIDQLTNEQRRAICLKFLDGISNRDIARKMGKRIGAIRALQMRGLQTLSKILKKPEQDVSKS